MSLLWLWQGVDSISLLFLFPSFYLCGQNNIWFRCFKPFTSLDYINIRCVFHLLWNCKHYLSCKKTYSHAFKKDFFVKNESSQICCFLVLFFLIWYLNANRTQNWKTFRICEAVSLLQVYFFMVFGEKKNNCTCNCKLRKISFLASCRQITFTLVTDWPRETTTCLHSQF